MVELTIEQIVKIVIAVLVLVVVLGGAYFIFKDKILSYFGDLAPSEKQDLSSPYYQELLGNDENLIGTIDKEQHIIVDGKKTGYYLKKRSIKRPAAWWFDKEVGVIDKNNKLLAEPEEIAKDEQGILSIINGAEK